MSFGQLALPTSRSSRGRLTPRSTHWSLASATCGWPVSSSLGARSLPVTLHNLERRSQHTPNRINLIKSNLNLSITLGHFLFYHSFACFRSNLCAHRLCSLDLERDESLARRRTKVRQPSLCWAVSLGRRLISEFISLSKQRHEKAWQRQTAWLELLNRADLSSNQLKPDATRPLHLIRDKGEANLQTHSWWWFYSRWLSWHLFLTSWNLTVAHWSASII